MATQARILEVQAADAFLAEPKRLQGAPPTWVTSERDKELTARWLVEDSLGAVIAHLRFKCPRRYRAFPSVSVIFRGQPLWRIDLVPPDEMKLNPPCAAAKGLPAQILGSHCHGWPDNREYVLESPIWDLPCRRPVQVQLRRLTNVVPWLCHEINLSLTHEQHGFDVPPRSDLFDVG